MCMAFHHWQSAVLDIATLDLHRALHSDRVDRTVSQRFGYGCTDKLSSSPGFQFCVSFHCTHDGNQAPSQSHCMVTCGQGTSSGLMCSSVSVLCTCVQDGRWSKRIFQIFETCFEGGSVEMEAGASPASISVRCFHR